MTQRTAYKLGRLLAALEHLGATDDVMPMWDNPQAMAPAVSKATQNAADIIAPIMEQLPPDAFGRDGLPNTESSDFALGYYHQRADLRSGELPSAYQGDEPDLDERLEVRLDAGLKGWVLDNGGSKLVRALLRAERARRSVV